MNLLFYRFHFIYLFIYLFISKENIQHKVNKKCTYKVTSAGSALGASKVFVLLTLIIITLIILIYFYSTRNHNYWTKRNIKHDPPVPLFGNSFQNICGLKSWTQISEELYKKYPGEKVIGYFKSNTPELVINDPELIRHILNIDFAYFYPRGFGKDVDDPILLNLFFADGDKWKLLRQRLTGAFTTSKLKSMFPLVVRCAEKLQGAADELAVRGVEYNVRELMARFTIEFIGACGFGVEMDTINNEHSQFRELGKLIFTRTVKNIIYTFLIEIFPVLNNVLILSRKEIVDTMTDLFTKIREQRYFKPIGRHDFVDLLLELEMKGIIQGESIEKKNADGSPVHVEMEMDVKVMIAQLYIFFAAGFETSSSATSSTLHQLAYNPEVQRRLHDEVDSVLMKYDNKLSYEAIEEMTLLDMTFKESMRMFPPVGVLKRVCAKKYTLPGTDITIDPGVKILIPIQAIQNNEQYFDNPSEFRPERFLPEAEKGRHKFVYLPFGEGPRACIGMRMGQMQSLAGLAALLHRFKFEPGPSSLPRLQVNPLFNIVQSLKSGAPLIIRRRKENDAQK